MHQSKITFQTLPDDKDSAPISQVAGTSSLTGA